MEYTNERLTGQRVFPDRWISDVWAAGDEQPIHPNPSILVLQKQLALKGLTKQNNVEFIHQVISPTH
jgi:hypothetical protein